MSSLNTTLAGRPGALGRGRRHRTVAAAPAEAGIGPRLPVTLLIVSLILPLQFHIGSLALSPYRSVLIVLTVPCLVMWATGRAGRIRLADIALILFALWAALSLIVIHGAAAAVQPAGILFVEVVGPYLLARCCVRNAADARSFARKLFVAAAILLPFAILEAVSRQAVLLQIFGAIVPSHPIVYEEIRLGLRRAQTAFEHPILFGVFIASTVSYTHLVLGQGQTVLKRWFQTGIIAAAALMSLSSGPLLALAVQAMLIGWNWLMRPFVQRWKLLGGLMLAGYVFTALASDQTVVQVYISRFTFNAQTAWYRLLIWDYGMASVFAHPLFGVGLGDWVKASWMTDSIDMFWLLNAMRYGMPAGLLLLACLILNCATVGMRPVADPVLEQHKAAYLFTMVGFLLVGCTVHFWGPVAVLFYFIMGSGQWLLDDGAATGARRQGARLRRPVQARDQRA